MISDHGKVVGVAFFVNIQCLFFLTGWLSSLNFSRLNNL